MNPDKSLGLDVIMEYCGSLFGGVALVVYQLQIAYARKRCVWMKGVMFVMPQVRLTLAF